MAQTVFNRYEKKYLMPESVYHELRSVSYTHLDVYKRQIGDVVEAKIMKAKKNYGYARLMNILTPSRCV